MYNHTFLILNLILIINFNQSISSISSGWINIGINFVKYEMLQYDDIKAGVSPQYFTPQ